MAWRATLFAALLAAGCRKESAPTPADKAAPEARSGELPPLVIKRDTPQLFLTWVDEAGDFHTTEKPADVPSAAQKAVRVVVRGKEAGTGELVYVANLAETTPDGAFRVKTMTRDAWDEIGAARRKTRLEALAPPSAAPPAPSAPAARPSAGPKPVAGSVSAIVYGAEWCRPCHDAERYLRQRGVNVVKKDVDESEAAASEMRRKLERAGLHGASIPVIDVMGRILVGFSRGQLDRAIEAAQAQKPL